jgi:hypothetical protein
LRVARAARDPGHLSGRGNQPPAVSGAFRPARPRAAFSVDRPPGTDEYEFGTHHNVAQPADYPLAPAVDHPAANHDENDQATAASAPTSPTSPTTTYVLAIAFINVDYD